MTLHATLSLGVGVRQHSAARVLAVGTVPSTAACNPCLVLSGWHGIDVAPVSSATPLYRAVVRLTLQEWLDALVGCDVPLEKSVKAAVTGLMPS